MHIGFLGLLQLALIVLKLIEEITWSWWWVLLPTWISIGLSVLVLVIFGITTLAFVGTPRRGRRQRRSRL